VLDQHLCYGKVVILGSELSETPPGDIRGVRKWDSAQSAGLKSGTIVRVDRDPAIRYLF
jgi:hypothetical protein